jgi:hypothetical protein
MGRVKDLIDPRFKGMHDMLKTVDPTIDTGLSGMSCCDGPDFVNLFWFDLDRQ